jgi:hypothetical protein
MRAAGAVPPHVFCDQIGGDRSYGICFGLALQRAGKGLLLRFFLRAIEEAKQVVVACGFL